MLWEVAGCSVSDQLRCERCDLFFVSRVEREGKSSFLVGGQTLWCPREEERPQQAVQEVYRPIASKDTAEVIG